MTATFLQPAVLVVLHAEACSRDAARTVGEIAELARWARAIIGVHGGDWANSVLGRQVDFSSPAVWLSVAESDVLVHADAAEHRLYRPISGT